MDGPPVVALEAPRTSLCGESAVLFEPEGPLSLETQYRLWTLQDLAASWREVIDFQLGVNNLLLVLANDADPLAIAAKMQRVWPSMAAAGRAGRTIEVEVQYGGDVGIDLRHVAKHHGLSPREVVDLHAAPDYVVMAPGTSPGFGYLFGLDRRLHIARRQQPVMRPVGGAVMIGGAQASLGKPRKGTGEATQATGWYLLGIARDVPDPFDIALSSPFRVSPGDRIRFRPGRIDP